MGKTKTLYHPLNAPDGQEFELTHADAILAMGNNGGWYEKESSQNAKDAKFTGVKGAAEIPTEKKSN